jgi:hypothetical protein
MRKLIISLALLLFISISVQSQNSTNETYMHDKLSFGLGAGLDFGGFGGNLLFYPQKNVGLFAGAGYAIAGFGYNFGAKIRFVKEDQQPKIAPYITAMYGYNAAIAVTNATDFNKLFYGPSFGAGVDFKSKPEAKGYWTMGLLIPLRSADVDDYMDDLEDNHGVEFKSGLLPIAISVGYRFVIN